MTDHPMFLEYDATVNAFRSHLGGAFTSHTFESLDAARHDLRLIGLRLGAKTDLGTGRIEFLEPVAERADAFRLGSWARRLKAQDGPAPFIECSRAERASFPLPR